MTKQFKFIFALFFLFISQSIHSKDRYFKWLDPKTQLHVRINIETYELEGESETGNWQNRGKIILNTAIFNHIPPEIKNNFFFFDNGNRIRFTIDGSGHVFDYLPLKKELIRVDNTFHSGYNYQSNKFIRDGLIYSIGGEGFWNYSSSITYFDEKLREWEILRPQNNGPLTTSQGYQGYDSREDVYYSGASPIVSFLEDQKVDFVDDLFKFNFKSNNWEFLGKINPQLPFRKKTTVIWTGHLFLHFENSTIYIINPLINEVRVFKDYAKSYDSFKEYIVYKDTIVGFLAKNSGARVKIPIIEISKKSTYWGEFYSSANFLSWYYLGAILIIGLFVWRYKYLSKNSNLNYTKLERKLLNELLSLKPDEYLTTHDINEILDTTDKSQENQRRIRFNVIGQINNKLRSKLGSEKGIDRKPHAGDKRLMVYALDPQIVSDLRKLLR
jgi:hypothetical protein